MLNSTKFGLSALARSNNCSSLEQNFKQIGLALGYVQKLGQTLTNIHSIDFFREVPLKNKCYGMTAFAA